MKLDDAITAHTRWKLRLQLFVEGAGDKLDSKVVCRDDKCELGAWIYGEGKSLAARPEFAAVQKVHATFHRCAGDVVRAIEVGDRAKADRLLATDGPFDVASKETVVAIVRLKRALPAVAATPASPPGR